VIVEGISSEDLLYREAESYVSHHKTSKHQCTRLGYVSNLNSQASSPFKVFWIVIYIIIFGIFLSSQIYVCPPLKIFLPCYGMFSSCGLVSGKYPVTDSNVWCVRKEPHTTMDLLMTHGANTFVL